MITMERLSFAVAIVYGLILLAGGIGISILFGQIVADLIGSEVKNIFHKRTG